MVLLRIPKNYIVEYANKELKGPNAIIIGENYNNYLFTKFVVRKWDDNDWKGCKLLLSNLEKNHNIIIFVSKAPGGNIDGLNYPLNQSLLYYSVKTQVDWLNNYSIQNILVDSTFSCNKYN